MSFRTVRAVPALLLLAAAVALAAASMPPQAEASCYPWEGQAAWFDVAYEGCCSAVYNGGQFFQVRMVRYRNPNCTWGPWQPTGESRSVCRSGQCGTSEV